MYRRRFVVSESTRAVLLSGRAGFSPRGLRAGTLEDCGDGVGRVLDRREWRWWVGVKASGTCCIGVFVAY